MPSAFDAEFLETASPDLLDTFGETVTLLTQGGRELDLTAIVAREPVPYEERRADRRRVERCMVWGLVATNTGDDEAAFAHDDGAVPLKIPLGMLRDSDNRRKWDWTGESPQIQGGMIGVQFQRISIDDSGDLTPGIGR